MFQTMAKNFLFLLTSMNSGGFGISKMKPGGVQNKNIDQ